MDVFHGTRRTVANGLETFCDLCNHWVKGLLMREELPDESENAKLEPLARIDIGNSMQLEMRSNCPACCGIRQSLSRSAFSPVKNEDLALELYKSQSSYEFHEFRKFHGSIVYKDIYKTKHRCVFPTSHPDTESAHFEIFTKADVLPKLARALIDWERLLHWYEESSSIIGDNTLGGQHGYNYDNQCLPPGFLLINVAEACLVEVDVLNQPCYAALSYVWANSDNELTTVIENVQQSKQPGHFRKVKVPLLFQDSFQVCLKLGVEYLWVDRVCIVQDDHHKKGTQLDAMGKIYSAATVTIVSPEPNFVQQGLYGISQQRNPQVGFSLGDLLLLPSSPRDYWKSTWLTRGWTYQEGFLSRRLLIFGESMVHMTCRGSKRDDFEGFRSERFDKHEQFCGSFDTRATGFAAQLKSYSTRRLTYDTDRLNAFLGVLSGFGRHLYGVPLKVFDQAILWLPSDDHAQNRISKVAAVYEQFPSWSWASATMGVECHHNPEDWRPLYSTATWATVVSDLPTGSPTELLDVVQASQNPEAAKWIKIFRRYTSKMEVLPGYTPVKLALVAHFCERYRLLKERSTQQQTNDVVCSGAEDDTRISRYADMDYTGILAVMKAPIEQWTQNPYFEKFDKAIHQMPQGVRWEVLLRVAKPTFPDLKSASGPTSSLLEAAAKPGRILVHAPKRSIMVKYQMKFREGIHLWELNHGAHLIGRTEVDDYRHQELLSMKSHDTNPDVVEVDCLALSVMGVTIKYEGMGRSYVSNSMDPSSTVLVMIISKASDDGCSHRLGVGYADMQAWESCEAMLQTTILE